MWAVQCSGLLPRSQKQVDGKKPGKKATREVFRKRGIAVVERTKEERSGSPQAFVLPKQSLHKLLEQTESGDTQPHKGSHARTQANEKPRPAPHLPLMRINKVSCAYLRDLYGWRQKLPSDKALLLSAGWLTLGQQVSDPFKIRIEMVESKRERKFGRSKESQCWKKTANLH